MSETPRTWPENAEPTPEQLADWLAAATQAERIMFAEHAIHDSHRASNCFLRNHDAIKRELEYLRERLANARQETLDEFMKAWEARISAHGGDYSDDVGTDTSGDLKSAQIGADVTKGDDA